MMRVKKSGINYKTKNIFIHSTLRFSGILVAV